jgi:chemotaxis protein methyltransferase CheR
MRDSEFEFIRNLVYERSRISLGPEKRHLVSARLGKRLRATRIENVGEYCRLLRSPGSEQELSDLIDVISTNHTFFFREKAHFDFLRTRIIPQVREASRREAPGSFNVWSAACSTGEEPYSIAITLADNLRDRPWSILATDISHRVLSIAREATYRDDAVSQLSPELVLAHFQKGFGPEAGNVRVRPALRERVAFQQLNLLKTDPRGSGPFQLIFCRNVMIYFDRATQAELVTRLTRFLAPGGYLFVGHAESLTSVNHTLRQVQAAVYQRAA